MGRKLLVADDSVTIQKVIKLALSSEGYDILAVSDGKEAIRAIQEERPDVVLIDVTLPGADAYAVKRIINANPKLAGTNFILMLSAFERVDEKAIEEVVFQGRLIKPFDPSHLRKAVAELVNKPANLGVVPPSTGAIPSLPTTSMPPIMPAIEPTLAPPLPIESLDEEDMPPVQDMHPTLHEEPSNETVTEEEFQLDAPGETTRTSLSIEGLRPASEITPPPPPIGVNEEHTDPNFTLPEEAVAGRSLENDIKNLTESTIKMSGLDEWSLDDSNKMKDPPPPPAPTPPVAVVPPPPLILAPDDATRETPAPSMDKKAAIMKGLMTAPTRSLDDGGSSFPLATLQAGLTPPKPKVVTPVPMPGSAQKTVESKPMAPVPTPVATKAPPPVAKLTIPTPEYSAPPQLPITRAEIEQLIRKDIEAAIEKIAREAVPRIAEAIIRQEIEKILAEP